MSRILILVSIIMLLSACNGKESVSKIESGSIDFKIQYPEELLNKSISNLLPEVMNLYFTEDNLKFKIKGELNLFSLEYLSRQNGDSCFTLFKIGAQKLYYPLRKNELWFLFDKNPPIVFEEFKDSIKTIAGYNCRKVMIAYADKPNDFFVAYFTEEMNINKKLFKSPFYKIDGIPLQFEVQYNNMNYKFIAISVSNSIGDEDMTISDDYQLASPTEVHGLVNSLLN